MLARLQAGVPGAGRAAAAVSVAALVLLVSDVAGAGDPGPSAAGGLETAKIGGVTVLTNARGFTLYWFAPDTPAKSNCNGGCAAYWPPLTGTRGLSNNGTASGVSEPTRAELPPSTVPMSVGVRPAGIL